MSTLKCSDPGTNRLLYVVVEKILEPGESMPADWACFGTTGYEFVNQVNSLLVDPESADDLDSVYQRFTKQTRSFQQIAHENKLQVLRSTMASELHVLAHQLDRLAQLEWWSRDLTLNGLRHALEELIACFPVYRTYVTHEVRPCDRILILRAARRARKMNPLLGKELFDFICDTLMLREPRQTTVSPEYLGCQREFAGRFQQLTSPVMAKGVEDTALYRFNRLVSLNEVGSEPAKMGSTPEELHAFLQHRASIPPHGLSPLSTHDTKRSEDVRARINVLSEMPEEWGRRIENWRSLNQSLKVEVDEGVVAPDDNEEYFLYQTLIGAWPGDDEECSIDANFTERVQAYMTKAICEAKVHSSWIHPDTTYHSAVSTFIASLLDADRSATFLVDLREFLKRVLPLGRLNSLSQALIRCTAPGVPDIYQGCDSWDYSLVDPDNRRPVDYASRRQLLDRVAEPGASDTEPPLEYWQTELMSSGAKLLVTTRALHLRRTHVKLFQQGCYQPLAVEGPDARHLFAFLTHDNDAAVIVAVPRLVGRLNDKWGRNGNECRIEIDARTTLPDGFANRAWKNVFTGQHVQIPATAFSVNVLLGGLPLALLCCLPHGSP